MHSEFIASDCTVFRRRAFSAERVPGSRISSRPLLTLGWMRMYVSRLFDWIPRGCLAIRQPSGGDLIYGRWKCGGHSTIAHAPADCCCCCYCRRHWLSLAPSRGNYIRFHQLGCQQHFVTRKSGVPRLERDARSKHRHWTEAELHVTSGNHH